MWSWCFLNCMVLVEWKVIISLCLLVMILLCVRLCWGLLFVCDEGIMLVNWVIRKNVNKKV